MLSRRRVQEMKEDELRKTVIMPLLSAMKWRDVSESHGPSELGKDIVCWKLQDELGVRRNLAIVAKAVALSGRAGVSRASATEVSSQIRQCFNVPFHDPVRREQQYIDECWVISNRKIGKEAETAIASMLESSIMVRNVRYIDGNRLWELMQKYLPQAALQKLGEVGEVFDAVDTHYRVKGTTTGNGVVLSLEEKFPGAAAEKPLTFKTRFKFPDTEAGRAAREAFDMHLATGEAVEIPGEFTQVDLPDVLKTFLGDSGSVQRLRIDPAIQNRSLLVRIELAGDDGDFFALDYVDLKVLQAGREQVTFTNNHQPIPTRVTLVMNRITSHLEVNVSAPQFGLNVNRIMEALRLQQVYCKPFTMRVIDLDTGLQILECSSEVPLGEPPDPDFLDGTVDLVAIQNKVRRPLNFPDRDLTTEEIRQLDKLRFILHEKALRIGWNQFAFSMHPAGAQQVFDRFKDGNVAPFFMIRPESEDIFGTEFPLGRVRYSTEAARLANEEEVRAQLAQASGDDDTIRLKFVPSNDADNLTIEYLDWMEDGNILKQLGDNGNDA